MPFFIDRDNAEVKIVFSLVHIVPALLCNPVIDKPNILETRRAPCIKSEAGSCISALVDFNLILMIFFFFFFFTCVI